MKRLIILLVFLSITFVAFDITKHENKENPTIDIQKQGQECCQEIRDTIKKGETLYHIFKRYELNLAELLALKEASANVHRLGRLCPGQPYKIIIDDTSRISEFHYWIDDDNILNITRTDDGFCAEKKKVEYEKRILYVSGRIEDNLMSSVGVERENIVMAYQLSDIFAWDIDFTTDLRRGDVYRVVVEGLYHKGEFRKYGEILSAEFINDGQTYRAYRFEHGGKADYYDEEGESLRRSFLKAPLSFRGISSGFSHRRFHPVLKIYRPHLGVDYVAPSGTPVSAIGDGRVTFAGYKGGNGNLVIIRHPNGYRTYYGHLLKIEKGIRN
ncbi:MAG: peptidoglycan DD-metalloendopeptidase family protein, partial [Nitrospirota bacterium]